MKTTSSNGNGTRPAPITLTPLTATAANIVIPRRPAWAAGDILNEGQTRNLIELMADVVVRQREIIVEQARQNRELSLEADRLRIRLTRTG